MKVSWSEIKSFVDSRNLNIQHVESGNYYHIKASDDWYQLDHEMDKNASDTADLDDFENNYKADSNKTIKEKDPSGRGVVRTAVTTRGWHYQAHCVEFETSVKDSNHNRDRDGNDLGYTSLKFYDSNGDELTTQVAIDAGCVKTTMKWQADFDFEIISGQIRQTSNVTTDSYLYTSLFAPTGLAAPNDLLEIPFAQGGINLRYIGADEILRTDGRAGKLVRTSLGQYFETTINHDVGVKHKISTIYEIYKSLT